jgi:hypothetical protein
MTTEKQLKGAFLALSETLLWRFGASASSEVRERRLDAIACLSAVAGRVADWKALAAECDSYAPVVEALEAARAAVMRATGESQRLSALDEADAALERTSAILDGAGGGHGGRHGHNPSIGTPTRRSPQACAGML